MNCDKHMCMCLHMCEHMCAHAHTHTMPPSQKQGDRYSVWCDAFTMKILRPWNSALCCVCMCVCVTSCMWRPEVDYGCLLQLFSTLFIWAKVSHSALGTPIRASLASQLAKSSPPKRLDYRWAKNAHLFLVWVQGIWTQSSHTQGKHSSHWAISPSLALIFVFLTLCTSSWS